MHNENDPELTRQEFRYLNLETTKSEINFLCFDFTHDEKFIACGGREYDWDLDSYRPFIHVFEIESEKKIHTFDIQEPDMRYFDWLYFSDDDTFLLAAGVYSVIIYNFVNK